MTVKFIKMLLTLFLGLSVINSYAQITDLSTVSINAQENDKRVYNVSANEITWLRAPHFNFPEHVQNISHSGDTYNLTLALIIGVTGEVTDAKIAKSSGNSVLDRDALRTIATGRFAPFSINGRPVNARVLIPVTYVRQ